MATLKGKNLVQKGVRVASIVCLFVLRFYGPVNPMGYV